MTVTLYQGDNINRMTISEALPFNTYSEALDFIDEHPNFSLKYVLFDPERGDTAWEELDRAEDAIEVSASFFGEGYSLCTTMKDLTDSVRHTIKEMVETGASIAALKDYIDAAQEAVYRLEDADEGTGLLIHDGDLKTVEEIRVEDCAYVCNSKGKSIRIVAMYDDNDPY